MKTTIIYLFAAAFCFSVIACNNDTKTKTTNPDINEDVQEEISSEELARITPKDIDVNTPIPVTKLYNSFFEWKDKEVTIAGYAKMYMDSEVLKQSVEIIGEPGAKDVLFNCKFENELNQEVKKDDIVIIKGIIAKKSYSGIELTQCEFIGSNEDIADNKDISPYKLPKEPILAANLYNVYNSWDGVEITVIGNYNSTTTSTLSDGFTWRIDLDDPESGVKKVGCNMSSEPDNDYLRDNRSDVKIRGIIKGEFFGRVLMEDCVMVE
ncbi:MAG: hypothetical protein PHP52_01505 [Bacteroidales bacterium]|jgi:hypothetical protein|nr:hypothetical protein [Bacteroidales bacterium]MDD4217739.1 hypothetical protein [Bacteroidales bacterium]MDY0140442.1 hypothetical protein [Bacteroidales bacterium]